MIFIRIMLGVFIFTMFSYRISAAEENLHPMLKETQWIQSGTTEKYTFTDDTGTHIYREAIFFRHQNGKWFKTENLIFGEMAVKMFKEQVGKENPTLLLVQLEIDGVWHTGKPEDMRAFFITDETDMYQYKIIGVQIVLRDEHGKRIQRSIRKE